MTNRSEVYKCDVCGNIVEILHSGAGQLICCGQPMRVCRENFVDASKEKHVPVVARIPDGVKVVVGSIAHPMEEGHFIEWIEILIDGKDYRQFLRPGDIPEAIFPINAVTVTAREYCNLHGLWKKEEAL